MARRYFVRRAWFRLLGELFAVGWCLPLLARSLRLETRVVFSAWREIRPLKKCLACREWTQCQTYESKGGMCVECWRKVFESGAPEFDEEDVPF